MIKAHVVTVPVLGPRSKTVKVHRIELVLKPHVDSKAFDTIWRSFDMTLFAMLVGNRLLRSGSIGHYLAGTQMTYPYVLPPEAPVRVHFKPKELADFLTPYWSIEEIC